MLKRNRRVAYNEAELDITSFMNLMIILVPVLLMSMVFSHITVLGLKLPESSAGESGDEAEKQLELVLREAVIEVNYPAGTQLRLIEKKEGQHDYELLSAVLQEVKRQLGEQQIEKRDILILAEPATDYQTLVAAMDTARSFDAVVAASLVKAELFPDIALGDAPGSVPGVIP